MKSADTKGPTGSRYARRCLEIQCALSETGAQSVTLQHVRPPVGQRDLIGHTDPL